MKRRVFDIIQIGNQRDFVSRLFDIILVAAIAVNIIVLFLQTFESMEPWRDLLSVLESVTVIVFIVEYALRIWTSCYLFPELSKAGAVIGFMLSFDGIIELFTILPFFFLSGFVAFRILRVVRIFHLFRINASYDSFHVIKAVLYDKRNQLLSSLAIIFILLLASSLCMYSAEHEAQPQAFRNAFSGLWWSVSTLLTVGYGDIYPVTIVGKAMAILIAFIGVGAVAIPTGIISAGFVEQYTLAQKQDGSADLALGLQTIILDLDSAWLGLSVTEVRDRFGAHIAMVRHHNRQFIPENTYILQLGDVLAVHIEQKDV